MTPPAELRPKKRYVVVQTRSVTVEARTEEEAETIGMLQLEYFESEYDDVQVTEELED